MHPNDVGTTASPGDGIPFPRRARVKFIIQYVLYKLVFLWREVKEPRLRLFIYELVYSLCQATKRRPRALRFLRITRITTRFGTFTVREGTMDAACVSPAFERPDLDRLLAELRLRVSSGHSVLFLDVGADVGTYAITVGNHLKGLGVLRVMAFEPSNSSYGLLRKNVGDNDLAAVVEPLQMALGAEAIASAVLRFDPREPGSSGLHSSFGHGTQTEEVQISTIDAQVALDTLADVVAMKLDVEGSEIAVLQGAAAVLSHAQEVLLLVEDCVDDSIVNYLKGAGWTFEDKLTPYNSFWIHHGSN